VGAETEAGAPAPGTAAAVPSPDGPARRARHRTRGARLGRLVPDRARALYWLAAAVVVTVVCLAYGFYPGGSQVPLMATYSTGMITCLHDQGLASLTSWCQATGAPAGAPALTGLPELYTEWALSFLPGMTAWRVNQLVGVLVVTLGVAGLLGLLRRWSVPRWIALLAALSYFLGPNLLQLNGFAHTFDGFILLPASLYLAVRVLDLMDRRRWLLAVPAALLVSLLMAFLDGYSYFGGAVVIGFLTLGRALQAWRDGRPGTGVAAGIAWLGALGGAALTYASWAPSSTYEAHPPLDFPARLGVDVASLFLPSSRYLYPDLIGLTPPVQTFWGALDTPPSNYLGYLTVLLAAIGVVAVLRKRRGVRWEVVAVGVAGAVTLLLAFGPTLKIAQYEPGLDASFLTLPTSFLYEHVPGFQSLRVSNRWLVTTRLCVVLLSAVGLAALWRRWGGRLRWRAAAVVLLAVLTLVEVLPEPGRIVDERRESLAKVNYLNGGIVPEAGRLLHDDELVLMLPSTNDFLADYLVPVTGVRSYNVGIDKNHSYAVSAWPDTVLAANAAYKAEGAPGAVEEICAVLAAGDADAVVLPSMDTRNGVLLHNDDAAAENERRLWALQLAEDPRFDATVGDWLVVLRPTAQMTCAAGG